jgi:dimethylargininase
MRAFNFTRAIVREPGRSVVNGLRSNHSVVPSYEAVLAEHRAYVAALREAGLAVEVLPPLEAFPDSVFVEDPALAFPEGAVLLRPGAPSRLGEREEMRGALQRHFERVLELGEGEYADGGDVLVTSQTVFIGLSKRTNLSGAEALQRHLVTLGRSARIVQTPRAILHFKTAVSLLAEETIFATAAMAKSGIFAGFDMIETPQGEEAGANLLRLNDIVLLGDAYPRTANMLVKKGFSIRTLCVREVAKLDAGLSCMSLRW